MNFYSFFEKLTIATCVVLIVALLLIGGLLIWNPAFVVLMLRYGIAGGCIIVGVFLLIRLLILFFRRK